MIYNEEIKQYMIYMVGNIEIVLYFIPCDNFWGERNIWTLYKKKLCHCYCALMSFFLQALVKLNYKDVNMIICDDHIKFESMIQL